MRSFWLLGLLMLVASLAEGTSGPAEATPYASFENSVTIPCHPPFAHPLGASYEVTWVDTCSTLDTFYNPTYRTDVVQHDGSIIFIGWGPRAITRDSQENPDGQVGFSPNDSIMFRQGGWGYIFEGPQIGGNGGDRWIPWVGPPAAGIARNAVINASGELLLKEGLVTRRGQTATPTVVPGPSCCVTTPPCCPQPVSEAILTPAQVQSWCSGDCARWRFSQLVEGNGYVNPRAVKLAAGSYVTLHLPAGVSADTPSGRVFGPTTCWVNEASVRLN